MATYAYSVVDGAGTMRNGTSEAENPDVLARRLREQGFTIREIKQAKAKKAGGNWFENLQRVKLTDLSIFCRQFSTMIDAGVSLVRCLDVLSQQQSNPRFKRIIIDIQKEVEAGNTLSKSLAKYPVSVQQPVYRSGPRRGSRRRPGRNLAAAFNIPRKRRGDEAQDQIGHDLPDHCHECGCD